MEAISYQDFGMKYKESDFALTNINLSIGEGEFVVLTGGTGSGKSTLIRQLKREFVSDRYTGSVKVLGKEVKDCTRGDTLSVGYVMQAAEEQIVTDKVAHELSFGLENMGLSSDEIRLRVSETAHFFGISHYMNRDTAELSGGEKQVLNLASVMAMRPKILLLDEPTSQLDEVAASKFLSLVYRINRELGTTIVIAEHRLDMLEQYSRVVIMDKGAIVYNGTEPKGYAELPVYARLGEALGKSVHSVVEAREALKDAIDCGRVDGEDAEETKLNLGDRVLKVRDLWYRYPKGDSDVLKGADLDLYRGEVLSIVGSNGAGKSTLLSIIAGTTIYHHGKVNNYGNKIVYIPQNVHFLEETVEREIDAAIKAYIAVFREQNKKSKDIAELTEKKRQELLDSKEKYIELFDLKKLLNSSPYQISGGEKAKLAILIALLSSPDILLLDEPTKGIDKDGKDIIEGIIKALIAENKAIILVSHDLEFVASVSMRVATLFDGQILSICTPKLLLSTNFLFTTTTSRITRGIADSIVTERELMKDIK